MGYLDCEFHKYLKNSGGVGKTGESLVSHQEEYGLVKTKYLIGTFKNTFSCLFLPFCLYV